MWRKAVLFATTLVALATASAAETRLMMVEDEACVWCKRWHAEVGDAYAKTSEGATAPLLRHDIDDAVPDGITLAYAPTFTPTFILLVDGQEVGRLEGYPGEDFFWPLLNKMLADHKIEVVVAKLDLH